MKKILTLLLCVAMCVSFSSCGISTPVEEQPSSSSASDELSNAEPIPVTPQIPVDVPKIEYKESIHGVQVWFDDNNNYTSVIISRIQNTGDTNLYLNPSTFDIEDLTGNFLATGTINAFPDIIGPGQTGYYYGEIDLKEAPSGELRAVSHLNIVESKVEPILFPVTETTFSYENYGFVEIMGRVENTTNQQQSLTCISVFMYDKTNKIIGHAFSFVTIPPNDKMGFTVTGIIADPERVASYDIIAYPNQYNY